MKHVRSIFICLLAVYCNSYSMGNQFNLTKENVVDELEDAINSRNLEKCRAASKFCYENDFLNSTINTEKQNTSLLHIACEKSLLPCNNHEQYSSTCNSCTISTEMPGILLHYGANPYIRDQKQYTALHISAALGNASVCKKILEAYKICICATHGTLAGLKNTTKWGRINDRTDQALTALHIAAQNGHFEICKILIDGNASVNASATPRSCFNIHPEGVLPLDLALENDHYEVCELLLGSQSIIRQETWNKVLNKESLRLCKLILSYRQRLKSGSLDVMQKNDKGNDLLDISVINDDVDFCTRLLTDQDLAISIPKRNIALHKAVGRNSHVMVELLLNNSAELNCKNDVGDAPLHIAVAKEYYDLCKLLCEKGANTNLPNEKQYTPLLLCASVHGNQTIGSKLIEYKASLNSQLPDKSTALHIAIKNGHYMFSQLLLSHEADITKKDEYMMTAPEWAENLGNPDISKHLEEFSCSFSSAQSCGKNHSQCKEDACKTCWKEWSKKYNALKNLIFEHTGSALSASSSERRDEEIQEYLNLKSKWSSILDLFKDRECIVCQEFTNDFMKCGCNQRCCEKDWKGIQETIGICRTCLTSFIDHISAKRKTWEFDWIAVPNKRKKEKHSDDNDLPDDNDLLDEEWHLINSAKESYKQGEKQETLSEDDAYGSHEIEDRTLNNFDFIRVKRENNLTLSEIEERDSVLIEDLKAYPFILEQYSSWKTRQDKSSQGEHAIVHNLLEDLFKQLFPQKNTGTTSSDDLDIDENINLFED